jgi:methionine sulfoxide reductase heme-binding subunit
LINENAKIINEYGKIINEYGISNFENNEYDISNVFFNFRNSRTFRTMMNWIKKNWGWMTVIVIGLMPLIGILKMINIDFTGSSESWITMDSFTMQGRHPGESSKEVSGAHIAVKETGEWAIRWLAAILSLTPIAILTGIKSRLHVRQAIGITAFIYAFLHLLFFCIDKGLMEAFKEFGNIMGLVATVVMLVLAITSNKRSMKFMRKKWKKLHRLAYVAALLAILHMILLEHGDWTPYAIILIIGFLLRITFFKEAINKLRMRNNPAPALT